MSYGRVNCCLYVCMQYYSNSYEQIGMKSYGEVQGGTMEISCNFGDDLGFSKMSE